MSAALPPNVIPLQRLATLRQAVRWGDKWAAHAEKMEMLYDLACIQRDLSEALRADCERELERLRGLIA